MASIKYSISPVPSIEEDFIAVIYKTSAPTEEVERQLIEAPHTEPQNINFSEIPPGEYIVAIHVTPDGEELGTKLIDFWVKAQNDNDMIQVFQFRVGDLAAPADGDDEYINPGLANYKIDWVHGGNGVSMWLKGVDWETTDNGFRLLNGYVFVQDQIVTYQVNYSTETDTGYSRAAAFTEIVQKDGDTSLLVGEANKWIRFVSLLNAAIDAELPDVSALDNGDGFLIECTRSAVKSLRVTGPIDFQGAELDEIYLGPGEIIKLIKYGSTYVFDPSGSRGGWDRVGDRGFSVKAVSTLDFYNMLLADRSVKSGNTYRRIYNFILNLPPDQRLSFGDSGENTTRRALWSVNTATKQFKTPDRRGLFTMGLENIGAADDKRPDNFPGGFRPWEVGPHDHPLPTDGGGSSDMKAIVNSANNDEGFSAANPTGVNNPDGVNLPNNEGLYPIIYI